MANNIPMFSTSIVIDETNKYIPMDLGDAVIAEGTYDSAYDLVVAAQTALQVIDGTFTCVLGSDGKVTIARTGTFSIYWKGDNPHGSDFDDDHAGTVLGYDDSANDTGASSYTSDWVAQCVWIPGVRPYSDTYDRPRKMGPATFVATSGLSSRTVVASHTIREMEFRHIPIEVFLEAESSIRGTYEEWWEAAASGTPFVMYESSDDVPASTQGSYGLVVTKDADMIKGHPRLAAGTALYSAKLSMVAQP